MILIILFLFLVSNIYKFRSSSKKSCYVDYSFGVH